MKTNNVDFGKSFKFKHKNADKDNDVIYTYSKMPSGDSAQVTWSKTKDFSAGSSEYSLDEAREMVECGLWVVQPNKIEVMYHSGGFISTPDNLLNQIKSFTATSKHSVNIYEGVYEVFRAGENGVYKCADDETLKKVMGALKVLDGVIHD